MDVFQLRDAVVDEYAAYTNSFLRIADPAIREVVDSALMDGHLWPDPLVQLSPAYEQTTTIDELVATHILHPLCARIFRHSATGETLSLYRHQRRAIDLAAQRHSFVVTTGTGSGKSLTYLLPIIDHILKHQPEQGRVRAMLVYPMNALINSQQAALTRFMSALSPHEQKIVRFARYTGQERDDEKRDLQRNPPHILLTNYVMLELMLTRPDEHVFVDRQHADVQFLVLDELHTYRGRQGADVALLVRRLRERSGNPRLICIGTSATMATGSPDKRHQAVARVASTLFGSEVAPEHVIEEALVRAIPAFNQPTVERLRAALHQDLPAVLTWQTIQTHPLAAWIEQTFSLTTEDAGQLRRAVPHTLQHGAAQLAASTGVDAATCQQQLATFLLRASGVVDSQNRPIFAFKLHQFISQGGAVFSTLEAPDQRTLTLTEQHRIGTPEAPQFLYPLVFCRECGQQYAMCRLDQDAVVPRPVMGWGDGETDGRSGYLLVEAGLWSEADTQEYLPDAWFTPNRRSIQKKYRPYVPQRVYARADGSLAAAAAPDTVECWFLPQPFLTCLRCGVVYTLRNKQDFRKLARLSSEGRSTATTLLSLATIDELRRSALEPQAHKLLSFTDNRQDASLQAGHFNDFTRVALLRSAMCRAVADHTPLDYRTIAAAVLHALNLPQEAYAREVATFPGALRRNEATLKRLLEYRVYEDLRHSWRITQPNLEQCGLIRIEYLDLAEICGSADLWQAHPLLAQTPAEQREYVVRTILEYMRRELALDVPILQPDYQETLQREVQAALDPDKAWAFDEHEPLRNATLFLLPTDASNRYGRSLSARSTVGRFLRSPAAWPSLTESLNEQAYHELLAAFVDALVGAGLLTYTDAERQAIQVRHDALLWTVGDGTPPPPDPLRSRRMEQLPAPTPEANIFFRQLYTRPTEHLATINGHEHTGQVTTADRIAREEQFRQGTLPVLFCSPTMELGIDIADLNVVHLRNVPPTPANYAQRSGRAGRSGQAALVLTYCSTSSGHDQYFFKRPADMVAGIVAPPQIDVVNEELIIAHVHAVWLSFTSLDLGHSMLEIIDTQQPAYPLHADVATKLTLSAERQHACLAACERMLSSHMAAVQAASWYSPDWLQKCIAQAPHTFDTSCDRWRELYRTAEAQITTARHQMDTAYHRAGGRATVEAAERQQREALRQKDLLANQSANRDQTDFYPYRYFASEGFLPGYNFPRLPVRVFLRTGHRDGEFLARPRFLALTEFSPQNVIYHEGRKFRVTRALLAGTNREGLFRSMKVCNQCGYFQDLHHDVCEYCATWLAAATSTTLVNCLLDMPTMSTQQIERISSEEEERRREGYTTTTHYRFAHDQHGVRRIQASVATADGDWQLDYGAAADLLRINHGWRRATSPGFTLDLHTGRWGKPPQEEDDLDESTTRQGVRLVVRDTRNLLVITLPEAISRSYDQTVSVQYALQRGIEELFQLEEQEIGTELLGTDQTRRILFWEAAEGGAGVLRRLVEEPDALAQTARTALKICHIDPETGAETQADDCVFACYRCLLSYANQFVHRNLNRQLILEGLHTLMNTAVTLADAPAAAANSTVDESLPAAVQQVWRYLSASERRLPDEVRTDPTSGQRYLCFAPAICVLCPEPDESIQSLHDDLLDQGYTVIVVDPTQALEAQIDAHPVLQGA